MLGRQQQKQQQFAKAKGGVLQVGVGRLAAVVARRGQSAAYRGVAVTGEVPRRSITASDAYAARRFSGCVALFITAAVGAQAATLCRSRRSQPESRYSRPDIILLYLRSERRG
ncbi:hypothetical protein K0M31_003580 [Melipona bicolor]|uniref:Uncharacterized protein n=1 Tax=Melipona bicolor TaxID=60889 RepID=A0AA40KPP0_9HYME|nr:hypothetical protein K0M31_003580 [Melipona bicolor]